MRKMDTLVKAMQTDAPTRDLMKLTSPATVERSILNNLVFDFEGQIKTRFAWGDLASEQANVKRRLTSDLARLRDANDHMHQLLTPAPAVSREARPGTPIEAAAHWIAGNSRSAKTAQEIQELTGSIRDALWQYRNANLLDPRTIESIHDAVYTPAPGQLERSFRSSSDPIFMGSDIGHSGFEKR